MNKIKRFLEKYYSVILIRTDVFNDIKFIRFNSSEIEIISMFENKIIHMRYFKETKKKVENLVKIFIECLKTDCEKNYIILPKGLDSCVGIIEDSELDSLSMLKCKGSNNEENISFIFSIGDPHGILTTGYTIEDDNYSFESLNKKLSFSEWNKKYLNETHKEFQERILCEYRNFRKDMGKKC